MATIPDYRKELTEEDQAAVERYIGMYNDVAETAKAGIDQSYAPAIAEQKSQLAALPQQYDSLRHQNDYELEVAARRFNDMMAMEGQKNSGLNRTEQAGLQAAHSQTSGDIAVQQKAAEQEIQNAISKILAEREKAKSDAALQYQTMGVQAANDRANQILSNYRDDAMTGWAYDQSEKEIMLNHKNTLDRDAIQQGYTHDNMNLQSQLNMNETTHSTNEGIRRDNNSAANDRTNTLYSAQVAQEYGGTSGGTDVDYDGYATLGTNAGLNIATRLGYYNPASKTFSYGYTISEDDKKGKTDQEIASAEQAAKAAEEAAKIKVAQEIFNSFYYATPVLKGDTWTVDYQSTIGGNDQSTIAFSNAMAAAGLGNYTGAIWLAKLGQNQIDNRTRTN